jgi:hypothetical protein
VLTIGAVLTVAVGAATVGAAAVGATAVAATAVELGATFVPARRNQESRNNKHQPSGIFVAVAGPFVCVILSIGCELAAICTIHDSIIGRNICPIGLQE